MAVDSNQLPRGVPEHDFWRYFVLAAIGVLYALAIGYIWINRLNVAFYTRSPYMIILGLLFLAADSVLNTLEFSVPSRD